MHLIQWVAAESFQFKGNCDKMNLQITYPVYQLGQKLFTFSSFLKIKSNKQKHFL